MTHSDILTELNAGRIAPIYFLHGDEEYFIDLVSDYIEENMLDEAEKSFNQVVLYGKETDFKQVIDQSMQFPMMASYRVVILKEAQSMNGFDKLIDYIKNPSQQTVLVISYKHKKFDKRKKSLWDALKKNAVILESKKLYDSQVPGTIINLAKDAGLVVSPKIAAIMAEHLGNELPKISNEVKKLRLNLEEGTSVTSDHIQKFVGISKDYNIFELQKAIGSRNKPKAYSIVKYFANNKKAHPIQMNVASLFNYFSSLFLARKYLKTDDRSFAQRIKVNPYFAKEYKSAASNYNFGQIKRAFGLLHEMDKQSKGVDARRTDELGIYQEFLFKLFAD